MKALKEQIREIVIDEYRVSFTNQEFFEKVSSRIAELISEDCLKKRKAVQIAQDVLG